MAGVDIKNTMNNIKTNYQNADKNKKNIIEAEIKRILNEVEEVIGEKDD